MKREQQGKGAQLEFAGQPARLVQPVLEDSKVAKEQREKKGTMGIQGRPASPEKKVKLGPKASEEDPVKLVLLGNGAHKGIVVLRVLREKKARWGQKEDAEEPVEPVIRETAGLRVKKVIEDLPVLPEKRVKEEKEEERAQLAPLVEQVLPV